MTPGDQDSLAAEHPDDTVASFEEEGNHFSNQVRNLFRKEFTKFTSMLSGSQKPHVVVLWKDTHEF